jgi:DNA polymerase III subunit epsilon
MDFTAIDFETANFDKSSICEVGLVAVKNNKVIKRISQLVKPKNNKFEKLHISIHEITPDMVKNSPEFDEVWKKIKPYIENKLVIAHSAKSAEKKMLEATLDLYNIPYPDFKLECTMELARQTLPQEILKIKTATKLEILCELYNIKLEHHNALSDAIACARLYVKFKKRVRYSHKKALEIEKRISEREKNKDAYGHENLKTDDFIPNFDIEDKSNRLYKRKIVFTGLTKISKTDAAKKAQSVGAQVIVSGSISKQTDFVVLGKNKGWAKKEKIDKLLAKGTDLTVLSEDEFLKMFDY